MHKWQRQDGESPRWYARFDIFRALGPSRTIEDAHRTAAAREGLKANRPGQQWFTNAKRYNWIERAAAWDTAERDRLRAIEEDRRFDAREQRLTMIDHLLQEIYNTLLHADLPAFSKEDARAWLPTLRVFFCQLLNTQRVEMGLPSIADDTDDQVAPFTADEFAAANKELIALYGHTAPSVPSAPPSTNGHTHE